MTYNANEIRAKVLLSIPSRIIWNTNFYFWYWFHFLSIPSRIIYTPKQKVPKAKVENFQFHQGLSYSGTFVDAEYHLNFQFHQGLSFLPFDRLRRIWTSFQFHQGLSGRGNGSLWRGVNKLSIPSRIIKIILLNHAIRILKTFNSIKDYQIHEITDKDGWKLKYSFNSIKDYQVYSAIDIICQCRRLSIPSRIIYVQL